MTIDCRDPVAIAEFWHGLLGGRVSESLPGWRRLDVGDGSPVLTFQPVTEPKTAKVRVHLDVDVDDLAAALERVQQLGGRSPGERHEYDEGVVVVVADPEGTEFCLVHRF